MSDSSSITLDAPTPRGSHSGDPDPRIPDSEPEEEEEEVPQPKVPAKDKGKQRQSQFVEHLSVEDTDHAFASGSSDGDDSPAAYPPASEDLAETRRIEMTLRKWEQDERERRRIQREGNNIPASNSGGVLGAVARRVSLLWMDKKAPREVNPELGVHEALESRESLELQKDPQSESSTPSRSPSPSPTTPTGHNPFNHPSDSLSPFADENGAGSSSAVMHESESNPSTPTQGTKVRRKRSTKDRPILEESVSFTRGHPPPAPLGLPPPKTPPPRSPIDGQPVRVTSPLVATPPEEFEELKETKWWHDWLCGWSEGSDRGGDHQAGKTNPFE